jgi:glucan 1,3-beta-glucosidase
MPFAGPGYTVFRDVRDPKYGAKGDGIKDDSDAIMRAVTEGSRCGMDCNATSVKGAIVYFPGGTYLVCKPIIQYYFTAFIGDPHNMPVIKACPGFSGIAVIDANVYYEHRQVDGVGVNWYYIICLPRLS